MALLFLMRHAKAEKAGLGIADFDRPLAPRGLADAAAIGAELARRFPLPERVLCSAARRTRETLERLSFSLPEDHVRFSRSLFDADGEGYLREARESGAASLLVIGHNPSVHEAAVALAGRGDDEALARLAQGFPTGAVAVFDIGPELAPRSGALQAFLAPGSMRP